MTKKQLKKIIEKLVEGSFSEGKIVESRVIRAIKALKSLKTADAIFALSEYMIALKRKERQHTMLVETTFPLSSVQINKMKKIIEKQVKITKVITKINPEILGGFKLQVGDEVWDQSLADKIKQVEEIIRG